MDSYVIKKDRVNRTVLKPGGGFFKQLIQYKYLLIMLIPVLAYYIIFSYLPMFGVVLAFKNYNYADGIFKSPWVGLKNFEFFFQSGSALLVTRNTFLYNIAFIFVNLILQLVVSIGISEIGNKYIKKVSQTFMLFPYFISWVVVSIFCYNLFSMDYGLVNTFRAMMGLGKVNIYAEAGAWKYILVMLNAWKGVGYGSIIYLAAITGIDTSYYEAAKIDGANAFQRIRHITIPSIVPSIITVVLLNLGSAFRGNFGMFYPLVGNNGLLFNATDVIDTFTYRALMNQNDFGMSSAVGLYQSLLCFIFIMLANGIVKKIDSDSSLF